MPHNTNWLTKTGHETALDICKQFLPLLLKQQKQLEESRLNKTAVDGEIIGTGEADFTKANVEYEFDHADKVFRLIDVPGIEGDESKCERMVQEAVAKAHVVFYVNGTNKKPEVNTAERIKTYLKRGATIYILCNIKGKADSYEFKEDQIDIEKTHGDSRQIGEQTRAVLKDILGEECIKDTICVQGLLGFSSLAIDKSDRTTIKPSRQKDLLKAQQAYLNAFGNRTEMRRFSKIDLVESSIRNKIDTFEEDIVESNKRKVIGLIDETLEVLKQSLMQQEELTAKIKKELDHFTKIIKDGFEQFSRSLTSKRNTTRNNFFTKISDKSCKIISENFRDKDTIERKIKNYISKEHRLFIQRLEQIYADALGLFNETLKQALERLKEDIERISFQSELRKESMKGISFQTAIQAIRFNMKDIGRALMNIGGYAYTGAMIGSTVPIIGTVIGAVCGTIVGIVLEIIGFFVVGKKKKIRDAQSKVRDEIEKAKREHSVGFKDETAKIINTIKEKLESVIYKPMNSDYLKLCDVSTILKAQITSIKEYRETIKGAPYGAL